MIILLHIWISSKSEKDYMASLIFDYGVGVHMKRWILCFNNLLWSKDKTFKFLLMEHILS